MNELKEKYADRLEIVAFPCNQFGKQENLKEKEILASLKHVRPGDRYEPKFPLTSKVQVNGAGASELFQFLRASLPLPSDQSAEDCPILDNTTKLCWAPISRTDIAWNFEKFLIDAEGRPVKRWSKKAPFLDLIPDIDALLTE